MSITDKLSWRQPAVREKNTNRGDAVNQLFYGNNLDVLRASIKDESVDLIYLDPPFNSNAW